MCSSWDFLHTTCLLFLPWADKREVWGEGKLLCRCLEHSEGKRRDGEKITVLWRQTEQPHWLSTSQKEWPNSPRKSGPADGGSKQGCPGYSIVCSLAISVQSVSSKIDIDRDGKSVLIKSKKTGAGDTAQWKKPCHTRVRLRDQIHNIHINARQAGCFTFDPN